MPSLTTIEGVEVQYITKDITSVTQGIVAHGCNCQIRMGRGVAAAIRQKWPVVYDEYSKLQQGRHLLGKAQIVNVAKDLYVVNMFTQEYYGSQGRYADPDAIRDSFVYVLNLSKESKLPIYIPRIGAGLGGLDWESEVVPVLFEAIDSNDYLGAIYICDLPQSK